MLAWAILAMTSTSAPADLLVAEERPTAVVVRMTGKHADPGISRAKLIETVDGVLRRRSALAAVSPERLGVETAQLDACPFERRLSCWLQEVQRSSPRGRAPQFLILLTTQKDGEELSLDGLVLEVAPSLQLVEQSPLSDAETLGRLESTLFAKGIRISPVSLAYGPEQDAELSTLLENQLATLFEQRPELAPWGEIEVQTDLPGLELCLGDRCLGRTTSTRTTISNVPSGDYSLEVRDPGTHAQLRSKRVRLQSGQRRNLDLRAPPPRPAEQIHTIATWTGAAVATVGLASLVWGIAAQGSDDFVDCRQTECGFKFVGTCRALGGDTTGCSDNRGLLLAPFGMALLAAGGTSVFGYARASDEEFAWWWAPISLVLGVAVYSLSAIAY